MKSSTSFVLLLALLTAPSESSTANETLSDSATNDSGIDIAGLSNATVNQITAIGPNENITNTDLTDRMRQKEELRRQILALLDDLDKAIPDNSTAKANETADNTDASLNNQSMVDNSTLIKAAGNVTLDNASTNATETLINDVSAMDNITVTKSVNSIAENDSSTNNSTAKIETTTVHDTLVANSTDSSIVSPSIASTEQPVVSPIISVSENPLVSPTIVGQTDTTIAVGEGTMNTTDVGETTVTTQASTTTVVQA
jgi:hypothetical protein